MKASYIYICPTRPPHPPNLVQTISTRVMIYSVVTGDFVLGTGTLSFEKNVLATG